MTTPDRTRRTTWEMDQDPALAGALRQRIPGREFTEAIQAMQASNTEMMTGQAGLGETVQEDVIARANTQDGRTVYAAIEISITVNGGDVTGARERARTIARATGAPAEAVVIGARAGERAAAMMADGKTRLVRYPAG